MTIRELTAFDLEEILPLYSAVGWTSYTDRPEMLKTAWENSLLILGAYDGGRLIGAVRAVGDGASIVYVQDILVLPEYQRRGIGTRLLRTLMERYPSVHQLALMTDDTPETVSFYQSVGLVKVDDTGGCAFIKYG